VRAGVVGLGLIGGSILRGLAAVGVEVAGHDASPAVREAAAAECFAVAADAAELARGCDLVLVAVPPEATADAVAAALAADPGVVVADTASVKAPVLDAVRTQAPGAASRYVPAHPLAGAATTGWAASSRETVAGAVWAVCPPEPRAPLEPLCRLSDLVEPLGGRLIACSAPEHDDAVARTSHVPHVAAQALTRILGDEEGGLRAALSGGAYRDMTRVARSDPALWVEILSMNRAGVVAALDELAEELRWYRAALEGGDRSGLARTWAGAREVLAAVDAVRWAPATWEESTLEPPSWDGLVALGRAGRAVRRLRVEGQALRFEVIA